MRLIRFIKRLKVEYQKHGSYMRWRNLIRIAWIKSIH